MLTKGFMAMVLGLFGGPGLLLGQSDSLRREPAVGIHFVLYDFNSAANLRFIGLGNTLRSGSLTQVGAMQPGLSITYVQGLSGHVDYQLRYAGAFIGYPLGNTSSGSSSDYGEQFLLSSLDATLQLKLLNDRHWVSPFLTAGAGAFGFKGTYGTYVPLGLGVQVNFFDEAFVYINLEYHVAVSETAVPVLFYSIGVAGNIGRSKFRLSSP